MRGGELVGYFGIGNNLALGLAPLAASLLLAAGVAYDTAFFIACGMAVIVIAVMLPAAESPHQRMRGELRWLSGLLSKRALTPAGLLPTVSYTYGTLSTFVAVSAVQEGLSKSSVAWFWLIYAASLISVRLFSGRLADRFGRSATIEPGLLLTATAMVIVAALPGLTWLLLSAVLYAAGFGLVYPALLALTVDRVGVNGRGSAMATFSAAFGVGIGLGAVISGVIFSILGFRAMFAICGLVPLAGLVMYVAMLQRHGGTKALMQ